MTKIPTIGFLATTLILGGGVLQSAGAQQTNRAPPTYNADSSPRYQEPAPVTPAPLPPMNPVAGSESVAPPAPLPDTPAGPGGSPPLLQVHNDHGIRYLSGGVGEGERTELDAQSNQFNLRLLFAVQGSGEYLSAVRVNIQDTHGAAILTAESNGPWFLAQLAPGDYTVEASVPGQAQQPPRQTAHIEGSRQSRLDFRWH